MYHSAMAVILIFAQLLYMVSIKSRHACTLRLLWIY